MSDVSSEVRTFGSEVRPDYYGPGGVYEPLRVIDAWGLSFRLGNALKYVARAGKKPGTSALEDLRKAATYISLEIARLEECADNDAKPGISPGADLPKEGTCAPQPGLSTHSCGLGAIAGRYSGLESPRGVLIPKGYGAEWATGWQDAVVGLSLNNLTASLEHKAGWHAGLEFVKNYMVAEAK